MFTLLTGGARSGKSRAAETLASASDAPVVFFATGSAGDDEMADRIERHRAARPEHWSLVEEPVAVESELAAVDPMSTVIVDCLALWVTNQLEATDHQIVERAERLAEVLAARPGISVVVTNEVGSGIVPMNDVARRFRDLLGNVNQRFAAVADRTLLCVTGGVVPVVAMEDLA